MLTTTTRQQGTKCHTATTVTDFITACEDVVANGYAKINDHTMDSTTASMCCQVWKALNEKNRTITIAFWDKRIAQGGPPLATARLVNLFWKCTK